MNVVSIAAARSASTARRGTAPATTAAADEAFRIVQRGGRTFHVYGSVDDGNVFELPHRNSAGEPTWGGTPAA